VQPGDILFTRYNGSSDLVGVGAIYAGAPRYYPDKLIRVRLWPELSDLANYIELAVNTWASRKHISRHIKTTAGQQGISGESIKQTPIPLPPLAEAKEIMAVLEGAQDNINGDLSVGINSAIALRKSVLKAAFEGRLVEQDGADEPAEVLLTRLPAVGDSGTAARGCSRRARAAQ
jgi:type I restriction enzyme S subunit